MVATQTKLAREQRAFLILLAIPVLWGITFPLIHAVATTINPTLFVFWRFLLAAFLLLPVFILACRRGEIQRIDIIYGLIIGLINSGAFVLQVVALEYVDSARTAFLSGMNVVMVPFLLPLGG